MGALTVIHGTLAVGPTVSKSGTEERPIFTASMDLKSVRYDYIKRRKVADLITVHCQGKIAKKIIEDEESGSEFTLAKGDEVVVLAELQLHAKGPVFFVKKLSILGQEGFEYHIVCGAVERGAGGEIERDDREDGSWSNMTVRVPAEKWNEPGEFSSRNHKVSAWDRKADTLSKHIIPEKDDEDGERKWVFIAGESKTKKNEWTSEDGEEHVKWETQTDVDILEFTRVLTPPHVYGEIEDGGSAGAVDDDVAQTYAQASATALILEDLDDDDIPF